MGTTTLPDNAVVPLFCIPAINTDGKHLIRVVSLRKQHSAKNKLELKHRIPDDSNCKYQKNITILKYRTN